MEVRLYQTSDLDTLYDICIRTGHIGEDARALYRDHKVLGLVFAAPYAAISPDLCFVAVSGGRVVGYVVGTDDTRQFEAEMERRWWPDLRRAYAEPEVARRENWSGDEEYAYYFHHPKPLPEAVVSRYPAHLHMNLLPEAQGQGLGRQLFNAWREAVLAAGATRAHIGANRKNLGGRAFWAAMGFEDLTERLNLPEDGAIWMGQVL